MKIWYEFTNGEVSEIEVDEALGGLLVEFDRQEYNNDHKETRRHVSLNGLDYEGALFASPDDPAAEEGVSHVAIVRRLNRIYEKLRKNL